MPDSRFACLITLFLFNLLKVIESGTVEFSAHDFLIVINCNRSRRWLHQKV